MTEQTSVKYLPGFKTHPWRDSRINPICSQQSQANVKPLVDYKVAKELKSAGFKWKKDPRSIFDPEKMYQALAKYAPMENHRLIRDQYVRSGIALAYKVFARPEIEQPLRPYSLSEEDAYLMTTNLKGSAGLTNPGSKKQDSISVGIASAKRILDRVKVPEPCIAFHRTQFNQKTRLIWGYPLSVNLLEGLFARPLIDRFKGAYSPMIFGLQDGAIGVRLNSSSNRAKWAYSLDMSSFDSSVSSELIDIAFDIIATWFNLDAIEPESGQSYGYILHRVREYFKKTPIVMPDQRLYVGKNHGVPSGSYFTQFVDSVVNCIFCGAVSGRFHLNVSSDDIYILGDDLLMWSDHRVDLDEISDYGYRILGIHVHGSEKSEVTHWNEPVHFLGRIWVHCLPTDNEDKVIARLVFPERFRKYPDDPSKAHKLARQMIVNMASTFEVGWQIALKCYGDHLEPRRSEFIVESYEVLESAWYESNGKYHETSLSGYALYKKKYATPFSPVKTVGIGLFA